jgi:hypothetical protein
MTEMWGSELPLRSQQTDERLFLAVKLQRCKVCGGPARFDFCSPACVRTLRLQVRAAIAAKVAKPAAKPMSPTGKSK